MALRKLKKELDEARANPKSNEELDEAINDRSPIEELETENDTSPVEELEEDDDVLINDLPDVDDDKEEPKRSGEYTVVSRFSILFGATYKMFFEGDTIKAGQNISEKELERLVRNGYIK